MYPDHKQVKQLVPQYEYSIFKVSYLLVGFKKQFSNELEGGTNAKIDIQELCVNF